MQQFSPGQIIAGGCLLAFGASYLNTGFILQTGTSVSHMTGDISRIASGLSSLNSGHLQNLIHVLVATLGFIGGATLSGFLLHHPTLEIKMPYGRILSSLGLSLILAHFLYPFSSTIAIAIASAVCGTQNALASRYRGIVLRTTHLTGLFTDLGIHIGMRLRGHAIESWKIRIPIYIALSFLAGALVSSLLQLQHATHWILFAGIAYFIGGVCWSIYKRTGRRPNQ
jgi:Predicted membrane protein